MKTIKKSISVLLAVMMVLCLFTSLSFSASAAEAKSTISVTSNVCDPVSYQYDANDSQFKVTYYLKSEYKVIDVEAQLTYDSSVLRLAEDLTLEEVLPVFNEGCEINSGIDGKIIFNAINLNLYDFTNKGVFVSATFDIIGSGDTSVDLEVKDITGSTAKSFLEVNTAEEVQLVYFEYVDPDKFDMTAEGEVIGGSDSAVNVFGDINVDLANADGGNVYTGTADLEAGTYTFRVNENGTQMCYGGSFTDTMYGVQYSSAWKSATTFNATGGRYTFSYNTDTDRLTIKRKSFDDLVELFGDVNLELIKGSGTVFTGSVRLDAGTYQYRVNDRGTTKCFGGSFNDAVVNLQYRAEWKNATTFNATGGLYTVKYDTATEKLTMLHSPAGVGDVRVFGDIELSLIKESDTMYSAATSLAEGTYEFRIDELGTMKCYGGTYDNEMFGVQYRSDWKGATVFNAKGGNYTFRYNIKESRLFIYYKAPTDKVSIFGDFNVEMTKTTGNIYKGTTTLEAGTYSFRIDEKGTTMCAGGTYTDKMSNVLYSADWKAATVFKATGGTYTFTYNAATDRLTVA